MEYNEKAHRLAMLRRRIEPGSERRARFRETQKSPRRSRTSTLTSASWRTGRACLKGKLTLDHFDVTKDVPEPPPDQRRLLGSDQALRPHQVGGSAAGVHALTTEKYILFSRGMPFQHVCQETMRKYISNEKPVHKPEFKNAYKMLGGKGDCFVATSMIDVCRDETLPRLRRFRDARLARSRGGRLFIQWYYRHGPGLAAIADRAPQALRSGLGKVLDQLARWVDRPPSAGQL